MSDEEYEIESVLEARVEKQRSRGQKLIWKFRVRWKGYSAEDDTWEPIENFTGSDESVSHFWERVDTGGRDYRDIGKFKAGEVFIPVGPPKKRKGKEKERSPTKRKQESSELGRSASVEFATSSNPRKRDYDGEVADPEDCDNPPKRFRPATSSFSSRPNLLLMDASSPSKAVGMSGQPRDSLSPRPRFVEQEMHPTSPRSIPILNGELDVQSNSPVAHPSAIPSAEETASMKNRTMTNGADNLIPCSPAKDTLPLHRARIVNPLVKLLNDHHLASTKFQRAENSAANPLTPVSTSKRRKPGPGRSSDGLLFRAPTLLTAEKGKLKSVKGKEKTGSLANRMNDKEEPRSNEIPVAPVDPAIPMVPPKADELLQLAGADAGSAILSDYEDEDKGKSAPSDRGVIETRKSDIVSPALKESLLPSTIPDEKSNQIWKRSTIFGPLGLGTDVLTFDASTKTDLSSVPFQIILDHSYSIPVLLVDISIFSNSSTPNFVLASPRPPGKFYRGQYAVDLLATLRTRGTSARVRLSPEATNEDGPNFEHFVKRLSNDELFVAMVGQELLAFCTSRNVLFTQRLNVPSGLLSVDNILAIHVTIENRSAFADATANADDTAWSQYILGHR